MPRQGASLPTIADVPESPLRKNSTSKTCPQGCSGSSSWRTLIEQFRLSIGKAPGATSGSTGRYRRSVASAEQFRKDVLQTVTSTYDTIATQPGRALVVLGQKPDGVVLRLALRSQLPLLGLMLQRSVVIQAHIRKHRLERLALVLRKPPAKGWPIRISVTFVERDESTVQTWQAALPPGSQEENFGTGIIWGRSMGRATRRSCAY
jgi:hypothetical protein